MSQAELAERAHLTRVYVTRLEAGRQDPSLSTINAMAKALGVAITALLAEPSRERGMDARDKNRLVWLREVLVQAASGHKGWAWFENATSEAGQKRATATRELLAMSFVHKIGDSAGRNEPQSYRATDAGRKFLKDNDLESRGWIDRLDQVTFPKAPGPKSEKG